MNFYYIRVDCDNVGDKIELALLDNNYKKAQDIHTLVQTNIKSLSNKIGEIEEAEVLHIGADDILFRIPKNKFQYKKIEAIRKWFYSQTNVTISAGIGDTMRECLINLRKAKFKGKNITEMP